MTTYFSHPFCSNSTLSALGRELGIIPDPGIDLYEAYRMGTLFDAVVTEPHTLDLIRLQIIGTDYTFTKFEYENCRKMYASLKKHPLFAMMVKAGVSYQKECYIEGVPFSHEGFTFSLNMRAKLDFFLPGLVSDLKSTACTSQQQFETACEHFQYYRQMVLYCRLVGAVRAVIFGVSKENHEVFTVAINKGDARWMNGEEQLNHLAFKYYLTAA